MTIYKNILLATDLTDASMEFEKKAKTLAELHGAKLNILCALEPIPVPAYGFIAYANIDSYEEKVTEKLKETGQALNIPEANQYFIKDRGKVAIVNLAKELDIDLIVVGSHENVPVFGAVGSTAAAVVNYAPCDVIVLRK